MFRLSPAQKKLIFISLSFFILGMIATGFISMGLKHSSETEFCVSCHTMQTSLNELKQSVHWSSASGVHAGCADCHVPKSFFPLMQAKLLAAKDVWHEFLGTVDTPEKYEARRWEMANVVWKKMKATDSRECRSCHSFDHMDLSEQDRSASRKHDKAIDKGQTCIDCHKGIAHEEPEPPTEE
jgi:cytochrome c-type protein NapC